MRTLAPVLLLTLAFAACVDPPIEESPANAPPLAIISGTVTVTGVAARGDVYLFLLPQPRTETGCPDLGTSAVAPADVVRIAEADAFRDGGGTVHSAEFVIPHVLPGCWSISALVDADGDFNPLFGIGAGSTFGDAAGAALLEPPAPGTQPRLRVLEINGPVARTGVQVLVAATIPFERPSFTVLAADPANRPGIGVTAAAPVAMILTAKVFDGAWVSTVDPTGPIQALFPLFVIPGEGESPPQTAGLQVLLRKLAPPGTAAPWSLDEQFPLTIPAQIDASDLTPDGTGFVVTPEIRVFVPPVALLPGPGPPNPRPLALWETEAAGDRSRSPIGDYAIFVRIEATNQTWQIPNELLLLEGDASQSLTFQVRP